MCNLVISVSSKFIALASVYIAWVAYRRSTQHIVEIIQVSSGFCQSVSQPNGFHYFSLHVRNIGLPFPEMSILLSFDAKGGHGRIIQPLRAIDIPTDCSRDAARDVATGLVVKFGWHSNEMSENERRSLSELTDLHKRQAILSVYCAGYRVRVIRLSTLELRLLKWWRNVLRRIGSRLKLGFYNENPNSWRARFRYHESTILPEAISEFVYNLRHD